MTKNMGKPIDKLVKHPTVKEIDEIGAMLDKLDAKYRIEVDINMGDCIVTWGHQSENKLNQPWKLK